MKSQPILLRTMSASVTVQQQRSVLMSLAHTTTKDHEDVPSLGSHRGPQDVQKFCRAVSDPQLLQEVGEWACILPGLHSRAGADGRGVPELPIIC